MLNVSWLTWTRSGGTRSQKSNLQTDTVWQNVQFNRSIYFFIRSYGDVGDTRPLRFYSLFKTKAQNKPNTNKQRIRRRGKTREPLIAAPFTSHGCHGYSRCVCLFWGFFWLNPLLFLPAALTDQYSDGISFPHAGSLRDNYLSLSGINLFWVFFPRLSVNTSGVFSVR